MTGASSGIGRATAEGFARRRAIVLAAARRSDVLRELVDGAADLPGSIVAVPTDVTDAEQVAALAGRAVDTFGRLDVWVNNAAVTAFGRVEEVPLEDYERLWDVNVLGYLRGIRAALPHMREQRKGIIVNVSSVVGRVGQPYATAYVMTKHAIRALSMGLRQELYIDGMKGIEVCSVMPGSIDTPLFRHGANYTGWAPKPMSPVYDPTEVASAIVRCAQRPRPEVFVGGAARAMNLQSHLSPRAAERTLARHVDKDHFQKETPVDPHKGNSTSRRPTGGTPQTAGSATPAPSGAGRRCSAWDWAVWRGCERARAASLAHREPVHGGSAVGTSIRSRLPGPCPAGFASTPDSAGC